MTGIDDLIICPQCLKPMSDEIDAITCKHCGYQEGNRFTINTLDGSIDLRDNGKPMTYKETVDLLNKLNNENEQLKQKVNFYKYFQKDARKLEKENEQLKLKNELLEQDLDYCVHQFEEDVKNILLDLKGGLND